MRPIDPSSDGHAGYRRRDGDADGAEVDAASDAALPNAAPDAALPHAAPDAALPHAAPDVALTEDPSDATSFESESGHAPNAVLPGPGRGAAPDAALDIVILGLSISSSWGNGHATTYRSLLREMTRRGHRVTFLERDVEWYASNRDLPNPSFCHLALYSSLEDLQVQHGDTVRSADVVIVGSFVPDGVKVARWALDNSGGVSAFYDIDTPVTLAKLDRRDYEYLTPDLIGEFDLYLSFTGGGVLERLEEEFGSPAARALYCSVDAEEYYPEPVEVTHDLGYMGTYSTDRQPRLETRLIQPAQEWREGRFIVAGPGYPDDLAWPPNVDHVHHLPPSQHRRFYNSQRFTLNLTRADMVRSGYAPSVRLFEAAACGTTIISDYWVGIESLFEPGSEILISNSADDTLRYLQTISERERLDVGRLARRRVLSAHTSAHRAKELETYLLEALKKKNLTAAD